jgi:hypothetical protein
MDREDLEETIISELSKKIKDINTIVERITKDIESLSTTAVETYTYLQMIKYLPTHEQSQLLSIKPCELNKIRRACKLTRNSPTLNRSLLARFDIIP